MTKHDINRVSWNWPWEASWAGFRNSSRVGPENLQQAINPGWMFGGLVVNNYNSSAPDVEQAIASEQSYGRQLGHVSDALAAIIETMPKLQGDERIREFEETLQDIQRIKKEHQQARLERLEQDLQTLKNEDPEAWKVLMRTAISANERSTTRPA